MKYASSETTNIYSLQYLLVVCKWSTRVRRQRTSTASNISPCSLQMKYESSETPPWSESYWFGIFFHRFHVSGHPEELLFRFFELRDSPKDCFPKFWGFGTPRKRVFQNFEASGLPDGSFSQKTTRRGIPKHCFSEFLPFGMPRSTIFPIFRSLLASETLLFPFFCISLVVSYKSV